MNNSPIKFVKKSLIYSLVIIFSGTILFEFIGDFLLPLILNEYNSDISKYISLLLYTLPYGVITLQTTYAINMAGKLVSLIHIQIIQIVIMILGIILIGDKISVENLIYLFIFSSIFVSIFATYKLIKWNSFLRLFILKAYFVIILIQSCLLLLTS